MRRQSSPSRQTSANRPEGSVLDQTHVRYSYKHHCMVSLTVADAVDQSEWHLPTFDLRNEYKYHYKLHSIDAYFWTQQDALQFFSGVRRVLPPCQVEVLDEPAQPTSMSSVVQKLERAAISDPPYGVGASTTTQQPSAVMPAVPKAPGAVPPPPPPQDNFVPMAYNPAAPAPPETVRHRDKTPPLDDDPLNPLAVTVAHDYHRQPFTPALPPPSQPKGGGRGGRSWKARHTPSTTGCNGAGGYSARAPGAGKPLHAHHE